LIAGIEIENSGPFLRIIGNAIGLCNKIILIWSQFVLPRPFWAVVGNNAGGGKSNVSVRLFAFFKGWQFSFLLFTNHFSRLLFIPSLHVTVRINEGRSDSKSFVLSFVL